AYSIVVLSTDSNFTFKPQDGVLYSASFYYGDRMINDKNVIVYSGHDSSATVFNLHSGTDYYISVFSYEIKNGKPAYYLNTYAKNKFKTLGEKIDFSFSYEDSCQFTNKVKFTNNSNTSNSNPTY
ncbi:MAG: hypothetical protein IT244_13825, partial [Bacteroidia bacterium]|nr:hypothetical protein [Bacteroidia bacterium]